METPHNHHGILSPSLSLGHRWEEGRMIEKVHGIDRHKSFSTISVLDRQGEEVRFEGVCRDLAKYVEGLGSSDAVVMEASTGSFWWAEQVEARGAQCFVVDPHKFRIIKDSWNKTDKHDARNLAKALWVHVVTGEFGIPTVYKPSGVVRELRRLFAQYCLLNRQISTHKNNVQAIFVDNGVELKKEVKRGLFASESGLELSRQINISAASHVCLELSLQILWKVQEAKERLAADILLAGEPLKSQVELLISIKGVTPLIALAFLADVADIRRFRTLRKMNAYLGLVPRASNSGGKERLGHITRESRKLRRTILTQCVHHVAASSISLDRYYRELRERRGTGRARIAVIRKLCGMMRRMLLIGERYRWLDGPLYEKKLRQYERVLKRAKEEWPAA
jgi:transposase